MPRSPFHAGEQAVQERLGVRSVEVGASKGVRGFLPQQHRDFYASLPMLIASARDRGGRPWASMLYGAPGFVSSPDETTLVVTGVPELEDPLHDGLASGSDIGFLGIDFATLRRNRANGVVRESWAGGFQCTVKQTYGNCQKYITRREWSWADMPSPIPATSGIRLTALQRSWLAHADTFFIATGYRGNDDAPSSGMDASHRGGPPGFI
jgi:predicted pyridoxine 5'-phosphate oxidase superfamily flavin-nucleotide-binding protein